MINLPFKLGVSLLKDAEGRITLDIPFDGSFDTPGFGMASAAGSAAKEIFTELVKSPFKLLGKLGGGDDDQDLQYVEFATGSAVLEERERSCRCGANAARRAVAPEADALALQEQAFHEALMAEGVTREQIETIIPLEALEQLYVATVAGASLDALRSTHTPAPEAEGAEPTLDEPAYRQEMRDTIIAAQPVDQATVAALASQRAEAIRTSLVEQGGLDSGRVAIVDEPFSEPVEGNWVRCQLEVAAE